MKSCSYRSLRSGGFWLAVACGLLLSSRPARAALVAPNAFESTEAPQGFTLASAGGPRTFQYQIALSHLGTMPAGSTIDGFSLRLNSTIVTSPAEDITFTDFEITLAEAANVITAFSTTTADNMENPVLVKDGELTFAANSLPAGGTPNAWAPSIVFDTPYTYQGGDLIILMSYTAGPTTLAVDAVTSAAASGYVARWNSGFNATTLANSGNSLVTQLHFNAVPEPAEYALAGALGLVGFAGWRRFRRAGASLQNI